MFKVWIAFGALAGLSAVGMAAASAHGLPARLPPDSLQSVRDAVQMQGWHAIVLVLCGVWMERGGPPLLPWAAAAFAAGLILFCGSVYMLQLGGTRLPYVPPTGGILLMAGWALLAASAVFA